ncbi:TraR/DksA family transcriptional regulator [Variovorax beijingensis]|jgi:DnaK suppressor protein|uniref:DnaK suppressor protein n=2 Tax=Variovorax TaxID=34072 RepID=A0AAE4BZF4_VARPD|nr:MULTISPECIES: TraR/DksA C4-type zinc finger protein [Variovorax]MDR6427415.1 DnaK suppressor protein [Variovorax paradoxus]MDR6454577.1 DnaK suppressor protein [Variovorax paradoxus]TWD85656.1 TraR/DksA family transcriptional regulator [Variovorax beijingensis]
MKHLNASDRDMLARKLEFLKSQALDDLRASAPGVPPAAADDAHEVRSHADEAETERQDDVRFAEIEVDRRRLSEIEQAQQRMSEGRYGICTDCGEDIPRERLLAQPMAIRCAACQAAAERARHR